MSNSFRDTVFIPVIQPGDDLPYKQTSVQVQISYQAQSTGVSYVNFSSDFSQQALNGCQAIGTIVAITLLIRAMTPLIKACRA